MKLLFIFWTIGWVNRDFVSLLLAVLFVIMFYFNYALGEKMDRKAYMYATIEDFVAVNRGRGDFYAVCVPDNVERVKQVLSNAGVTDEFVIQVSTLVPPDTITLVLRKETSTELV